MLWVRSGQSQECSGTMITHGVGKPYQGHLSIGQDDAALAATAQVCHRHLGYAVGGDGGILHIPALLLEQARQSPARDLKQDNQSHTWMESSRHLKAAKAWRYGVHHKKAGAKQTDTKEGLPAVEYPSIVMRISVAMGHCRAGWARSGIMRRGRGKEWVSQAAGASP